MPQIQVLPGAPGFGSQLGQSIGGGLSQGIGASLQQMLEQKAQHRKTQELLSALGIQTPSSTPGQTPSAAIEQASSPAQNKMQPLSQEQVLAASIMNPQLAPALSSIYKNQQKEIKESESKEIAQDSLNRMSEILKGGKLGLGSKLKSKAFGGETAEQVGEFESLSGALEALLVDKVSRGTLSNARFKYITDTLLPKANDREATIKGKLKALSKELKLKLPKEFEVNSNIYGGEKIKLTDPKTGKSFYPSSKEDVQQAKAAGWRVSRG